MYDISHISIWSIYFLREPEIVTGKKWFADYDFFIYENDAPLKQLGTYWP